MKDNLNNLSAGGAIGLVNGPSQHDINLAQTNHQMYQSFVRGTLSKKRQSQYSERKAAREKNLQHTLALKELAVHVPLSGSIPEDDSLNNTSGKNIFGLAKNQQAIRNMQLNQPSVMKNSTGAGGMLSKATVNDVGSAENVPHGMSSQVLINAGKKTMGITEAKLNTEGRKL